MKKSLITVIFLILAIAIILGAAYLIFAPTRYIDCGEDVNCMEENFVKCKPSKTTLIFNQTIEIEADIYETTINGKPLIVETEAENITEVHENEITVHGIENNLCVIDIKDLTISKPVVLECKFPANNLTLSDEFGNMWLNDGFDINQYCNTKIK